VRKLKLGPNSWKLTVPLALFAVVAFLLWVSVSSVQTPQKQAEHGQSEGQPYPNTTPYLPPVTAVGVEAMATVFLAIFAVGTLIIAADEISTNKRQSRAYIFIEKIEINRVVVGKTPIVTIVIKNYGKTPAYNFYVGFENLKLIRFERADSLSTADRGKVIPGSREALGPDAIRTAWAAYVTGKRRAKTLSAASMRRLQAGTHAIFFYGVAFYEDAFGDLHETTFRMFSGGPAGIHSVQMSAHDRGNDAD
jgi:hypothetical protein